jgi:hypothetical protein
VSERASNPWRELPVAAPFVPACDAPWLPLLQSRAAEADDEEASVALALNLQPEPFFGPHEAPVVVLLLNPGLGEDDARHHQRDDFTRALRAHVQSERGAPHFHLLDPTHGPGHRWWLRQVGPVLKASGGSVEQLAARLLCIEFFPYHSRSFGHAHLRLPSQRFGFALLRRAVQRGALVLCMRGYRHWCGAVPELANYSGLLRPRSARSASLSAGNLGAEGFARVLGALDVGRAALDTELRSRGRAAAFE